MSWLAAVNPDFVDKRFGEAAVTAALAKPRMYSEPPAIDGARLVASVVDTTGGRLSTPMKVAVRVTGDVIDVACTCRQPRMCDHAMWLLIDAAFCPALDIDALPAARAAALEARTLDERLAAWLPATTFDDFEIAAEPAILPDGRAAILLRHRVRGTTRFIPAKDVVAARLSQKRRALVDLTAPHHAEKNALVATRGQAAVVVELLKDEIGVLTAGFKTHLRYSRERVRPRIERDGERLVVEWRTERDSTKVGTAASTILFAGAFPWLWTGAERGFFPVADDVDLDAALGMQRVSSLPLDERVGRAVLMRGGGLGVDLPSAEELGLPPLERPTFTLSLTGTPLDVKGQLEAVYRAGRFRLGPIPARDRDRAAEVEAVALANVAGSSSKAESSWRGKTTR